MQRIPASVGFRSSARDGDSKLRFVYRLAYIWSTEAILTMRWIKSKMSKSKIHFRRQRPTHKSGRLARKPHYRNELYGYAYLIIMMMIVIIKVIAVP